MLGGLISYALLAALAMALVFAAFTDIKRREIDNWLNLAIALGAPLYWLASGLGWVEIAFQLGLALATFVVACVLFATRQMGGGDVKLITALALWFVPSNFLQLVVLMAMIGGGASIAMALFNMKRRPGEAMRDLTALVAAIAWVGFALAVTFGLATGRPLLGETATRSIAAWLPAGWGLLLVALALSAILGLGLTHIMRRQKSRLPIPYGVAIAAAGLLVLTDQHLAAGILSTTAG
ncbi:potassium:proton antiporter [Novosphingobium sp. PC22D]|uniref:A24 family peptidase n=1 Tax=Novosphingobium sp. PC22D TaxID=1962403 RepID=UPI000BF068A5|nr:prepilin peptidase [Novosphingobium sp. PC22D]PEQ14643.1 potassium:proton antiporter [Novosphingobium sp. PC22D]